MAGSYQGMLAVTDHLVAQLAATKDLELEAPEVAAQAPAGAR